MAGPLVAGVGVGVGELRTVKVVEVVEEGEGVNQDR